MVHTSKYFKSLWVGSRCYGKTLVKSCGSQIQTFPRNGLESGGFVQECPMALIVTVLATLTSRFTASNKAVNPSVSERMVPCGTGPKISFRPLRLSRRRVNLTFQELN